MKKILPVFLTLTLLVSVFAACGAKDTTPTTTEASQVEVPASALEILENIWASYAEEEKFSIIGGNIEANIMDAPGNYDMTYAENMTYNLLVPADRIENVTEAASMIHMMNANTFTCGAFRLAEGVSAADFGAAMHDAIHGNQWMCGFPDEMLIVSISDAYVIAAFGVTDAMGPFAAHLAEAYPNADILVSEPIA